MALPKTPACVHLIIHGIVQGVGYRYFAQHSATALGLTGWVRNLPDGNVEAEAEGERAHIEAWIEKLRRGPTMARVSELHIEWRPCTVQYNEFSLRF